ncbi:MAG: VIT1/CCC1 transporter family protein [Thermaerobacter sp.]|nr:VIT1/CCC1 transporter family protein [Thermaerobacter sp.]
MAENRLTHAEDKVHTPRARSIREVVFGVNDGLVSITGIIVGVTSSRMSSHQIIISGLAAVIAAAVSMGLGQYLSTVAQNEYFLAERGREYREVAEIPHEERAEVEQIFRRQGFNSDETKTLTARITADPDRWVDFMMKEELGILLDSLDNPWTSSVVMALAVIAGSIPPILPYLLIPNAQLAEIWAIISAIVVAFGLGVLKAKVAKSLWWRSGTQFLLVTAAAVVIGVIGGDLLGRAFG